MATWTALKAYIKDNYDVDADNGDSVKLTLRTKQGRSQTVYVSHTLSSSEIEFATIASPVGAVGSVDVTELLHLLDQHLVGGAAIIESNVVVRHAVPLAQLQPDEFQVPLHMIARTADAMEKELLGTDEL
jgi:hypothetical protein